jgi:hypothetical protein
MRCCYIDPLRPSRYKKQASLYVLGALEYPLVFFNSLILINHGSTIRPENL